MKTILVLSILALSTLSACGDDTTESTNNTTNNNTTANNTVPDADPVWILNIDGQAEISGSLALLNRITPDRLTVQFSSTEGTGQITIDGLAVGDVGTYAETVTTQFTGFTGAPNCGFSSNGDGTTPPLEIVVTENDGTAFHATFTFTDLKCSALTGGAEEPNANGSGEIVKN